MKVQIIAIQHHKTNYGLYKVRKQQYEVLHQFNRDICIDISGSGGMKYDFVFEIRQEVHFNQLLIDWLNNNYDEVQVQLIDTTYVDLGSSESITKSIERQQNKIMFLLDQRNKLDKNER